MYGGYQVQVGKVDGRVAMLIIGYPHPGLPIGVPVARILMEPNQAIDLAGELVEGACEIDPEQGPTEPTTRAIAAAISPTQRLRINRLQGSDFWTFSCPAHEDAGIGLWQDHPSALAAACDHYTDRHR